MNIDNFKRQHESISRQIEDIDVALSLTNIRNDAFNVSLKLSRLAGTILVHLKAEDDFLYPTLKASPNPDTRSTSERLHREMGSLAQNFLAYKETYQSASRISAQPEKFLAETKTIFAALRRRLETEDRELYTLVQ